MLREGGREGRHEGPARANFGLLESLHCQVITKME
jgi:hypothetical protein